ncbi:rCG44847 [Rattus norvegicus]|uniref:RCG44847 n=1 Tax=Rattus norvegicus TaxID=10116 RepID=A6I4K9_RAT|nr:rCG44847 [Rattus norvegicus]
MVPKSTDVQVPSIKFCNAYMLTRPLIYSKSICRLLLIPNTPLILCEKMSLCIV